MGEGVYVSVCFYSPLIHTPNKNIPNPILLLDIYNRTCIMNNMNIISLEKYITHKHSRLTDRQKRHAIYILDFYTKVRYYYINNTKVL